MKETIQTPSIRFKFQSGFSKYQLKDITEIVERPLQMGDESLYSLVTVKRRNEGIVKRGDFLGKDIKVKNQYTVRSGDFLISKRQIIHGACEIVPEALDGSIVSNEYYVLHGKEGILLNEYLNLLSKTSTLKKYYALACVGVDIEKMLFRIDDWSSRSVLIPSLDEQRKIVLFFSLIDQKIKKQQEKIEQLELFKKGMLQRIFSKESRFKDENGQDFPEWELKTLGELGQFSKGGILSKSDLSDTGEACILYGELYTRYTSVIDEVYSKTDASKNKVYGNINDVLIPSSGESAIDIAQASVLMVDKVLLGGDMNVFKPNKDVSGAFLSYQINSIKRNELAKLAQGASVVHLYSESLRGLTVWLPDYKEQLKIATFLALLDKMIAQEQKKLVSQNEMKSSYLRQMFI